MKPISMRIFDFAYLGSMFLGLLSFINAYPALKANLDATSGVAFSPVFIFGAYAFSAALGLLLWYLVSRKQMVFAKWILVALFLLSLIGVRGYFAGSMALAEIYDALALIAQAIAVAMLFRSDSIRWLGGTNSGPPPSDPT